MRMYDVGNQSQRGFFVLAENEPSAIDLAMAARHVVERANARMHDVTDIMVAYDDGKASLKLLLAGTREGHVVKVLQTLTIDQILAGVIKGTPGTWKFASEAADVQ